MRGKPGDQEPNIESWGYEIMRKENTVHQKNDVVNVPIKNGMSLRLKSYSFYVSSYTKILSEQKYAINKFSLISV